ncbi:pseudouridine synthase [Paucibacter sp. TC2R-5]|uniref:RluA family pseudouridine synthase n=1 Tax=Paucibacter sp. TC2R-5 TaxID=2893555 RepID=UPI0021E3E78F|nr:pseudouridine synthase [Paucibacter sp. TC2R-5]MCV2358796.1 pseudouridine synthase [Paucibacter sp. TC2R-5]
MSGTQVLGVGLDDEGLRVDFLFVNDALLLINKPSGLLSVPGRGEDKQDCAIHRVQRLYPEALIVHRLDMATSGLLLLARGAAMQRALSMAFEGRRVHKRYEALLAGNLPLPDAGEVDLPLITDWPNRPRQKIDHQIGKASLTRYRVLSRCAQQTRVELEPVTGRTHQLRVHMLALGHPIIGDTLYRGQAAPRMYLHARTLKLPDWDLSFESPPEF